MIRIPGVPFLPGTTFRDTSKTDFYRSQQFETRNGVQMLADKSSTKNYLKTDLPSLYPPNLIPNIPPWLLYDKQVLCFYGYFKENLPDVYLTSYRIRKVKILFYLEDGTIQIIEPKIENSGIPQGCIVSRQRIARSSASTENEFISIRDLNVNETIQIFDRVYHITGCDLFTRNFLNRCGIPVVDPIEIPIDPLEETRNTHSTKPKHSQIKKENDFRQFLKYDRKILKFFGYWDDKSEFGEIHNLEIYYYLSDDTIEIKEILTSNSGKDGPPIFLKRGKLPKVWNGLPLPGELISHQPILNVLGNSFGKSRYIKDFMDLGKKVSYYKDCDLKIGYHLDVFGRDVILTDCDSFTKEYYHEKYGIEDFTPIPNPAISKSIQIQQSYESKYERELPPWNGWGTHEESEQNCITIEPKPPRIDMNKFLKLDRFILRFGAKMLSKIKDNCERSFIISYFLADDTIQIYELAKRNSGFSGGEFLKRSKILLPNQNLYSSKRPEYYKPHHFYIGGTLNLRDYTFHIVSADEYTLLYMENHPYEFPYSNVKEIMTKIRNILKPKYKNFIAEYIKDVSIIDGISTMSYDKIRKLLIDLLENNITDHEVITVCRHFSAIKKSSSNLSDGKDREKIRSIVHWEINRNLWNDLERLKEYIYHIDGNETGFISEIKLKSIILGSRLPFNQDLIDAVLSVLNRNSNCEIEICDFINFIDVTKPVKPIQPINIGFELCPKETFLQSGLIVNWDKFLEEIDLEKEL